MRTELPMQYGEPSREHVSMMAATPRRLAGILSGITVDSPPPVDSEEVRNELRGTMSHVAAARIDPTFCEAVDQDLIQPVLAALAARGREAHPEEMYEIVSDLIPLILRLKYRVNFPRPWQVSASLGLPLRRFDSPSAETPSYPSGHAIQAGALCAYLGNRHPEIARDLDRVASLIGVTRLQLGVHFPMDVLVGLRVGRVLGSRMSK
jgi:membrane-associated phospholipid phosphatase